MVVGYLVVTKLGEICEFGEVVTTMLVWPKVAFIGLDTEALSLSLKTSIHS